MKEAIDILLTTYERPHFLKHTVKMINERTMYPYNLIVIDSNSQDNETRDWLNKTQKYGDIQRRVMLSENRGAPNALNEGFKFVRSEFFICTQDDLTPPDLRPCWLERMLHLAKKYPDYGGIFMRIQRTARLHVNEEKDLIESPKSCAAVFRISRRDDFRGKENPFGVRKHWESHSFTQSVEQLKKKSAMATKLYANHTGFMADNKGFEEGKTDYHTYSRERVHQGRDKPYMEIEYHSQYPVRLNHLYDRHELKRMEDWVVGKGRDDKETSMAQQDVLGKYCKGKGLDIGCGKHRKCHSDAIGVDIYPYGDHVDIIHDGGDLWMFADNELDYIVGCHSLEHFADTRAVLAEWHRALKPGGHVAVIVPDGETRPKVAINKGHKSAFTKGILYWFIREKFKVIRCEELERPHPHKVLIAVGTK